MQAIINIKSLNSDEHKKTPLELNQKQIYEGWVFTKPPFTSIMLVGG